MITRDTLVSPSGRALIKSGPLVTEELLETGARHVHRSTQIVDRGCLLTFRSEYTHRGFECRLAIKAVWTTASMRCLNLADRAYRLRGRPQHDAGRDLRASARAFPDRHLAVDQLADLGAVACLHPGAGPSEQYHRDRAVLDRIRRQLLYEAIEEIDEKQVDAVSATGANRMQVIDYAIVPQLLPAFLGISIFRWNINIRAPAILGLVGAGGLGLKLQSSLNMLAWPQVTMIFIVILGTVVVSE